MRRSLPDAAEAADQQARALAKASFEDLSTAITLANESKDVVNGMDSDTSSWLLEGVQAARKERKNRVCAEMSDAASEVSRVNEWIHRGDGEGRP